jgi:hypothetical protein
MSFDEKSTCRMAGAFHIYLISTGKPSLSDSNAASMIFMTNIICS